MDKLPMDAHLAIGPAPAEEDCVQIGDPDYYEKAMPECRRFIRRIREVLGPEPEGAELRIKSNPHDFGTFYEVEVRFDSSNEAAMKYAYDCEGEKCPSTWGEEKVDGSEAAAEGR